MRDLLTMCLGQDHGRADGRPAASLSGERLGEASLSCPLPTSRAAALFTTMWGPIWQAVLVQRRAGCDLVSYLTPRLFDHLGITRPTWEVDPQGYTFGAGGLFFTFPELHTFGQFYLQNGLWNGRQLLSPAWVKESTTKQVENGQQGYGYLFWGGPQDTFRADGKYGQLSILCREKMRSSPWWRSAGMSPPDGRHFRRTVSPAVRRRGFSINKKPSLFGKAFLLNASVRRSSPGLCPGSVYRQTAPAGSPPHR